MINKVILVGRLTKDIEVKTYESNGDFKKVGIFTLAVNRDKENTDFIQCRAWNKTVDILERYTSKGSQIGVEGNLRQKKWQTQNGENRQALEVNVQTIELLGSRNDSNGNYNQQGTNTYANAPKASDDSLNDVTFGDLPF